LPEARWSFFSSDNFRKFNIKKITIMGRGDKKTAKGKRFKGSFGKSRPVTKSPAQKATAVKKTAAKKTAKKES
jgi:30S ribosomal protein S31